MKLFVLLLAAVCVGSPLMGQPPACNCLENLNLTMAKTEANYAGYPAKVNARTRATYQALKRQLAQRAAKEANPKRCYYLLQQYVRFFADKHFIISYNAGADFDSTVAPCPPDYWQQGYARKTLAAVEGIYTNPDSTVKIGIYKTSTGVYKAIKIQSTVDSYPQGFVYFTLTPRGRQFIVKEYDAFLSTATPARLSGNLLQLWNHALWGKLYPQTITPDEQAELATWKNQNNGLAFKKLNPQTAYLKIPTFTNNDDKIQQLIAGADATIRSTPYLLVDLRGNGGGNTGWVFMLPYFMTNTVVQYPSLVRVTPDNVPLKLQDLEPFVNNPISEQYQKYFPAPVLNAYKKAYAELPTTTQPFYPVPGVNFPLDSITRYPQKIALMVDDFCGSSTEYFFSLSRQSKKVITYGTHTMGMMDYEGMSTPTPLPFHKFILTIPIAKSSWTDTQPIDQTGFTPDVLINLPHTQWIPFIAKDLPKR